MILLTKAIIFIVLAVLLFIAGIGFIVAAIIKRKNRQKSLIYVLIAFFFFFFTVVTGIYLLYKVGVTIVDNKDKPQAYIEEKLREAFTNGFKDSPQLDSIRAMQPDSITISNDYFIYCGEWDYYRMPLVYPYAMNAIDGLDDGYITDETGVEQLSDTNQANQLQHGIIRFAFNRDILIAEQKPSSDAPIRFIILSFEKSELETFDNLTEMRTTAEAKGFDVNTPMISVRDYYMSLWDH